MSGWLQPTGFYDCVLQFSEALAKNSPSRHLIIGIDRGPGSGSGPGWGDYQKWPGPGTTLFKEGKNIDLKIIGEDENCKSCT